MSYDILILFSGGADSIYCSQIAIQTGLRAYYLKIDYNQLHTEELSYADKYLKRIDKIHHSQQVKIDNLQIVSGLTNGDKNIYDNVHDMYVPSRNMMFVSIAASIAESKGIPIIWYGADLSDNIDSFPDCKQEWMIKINELLEINGSTKIKLESPTIGLGKDTIIKSLRNIMGDELDTYMYSGYGNFG